MKKYILLFVLLFCTVIFAQSQKIIDEKVEVDGQKVLLKLSFADNIIIEAWNNDFIELHVSVDIEDNNFNDYYSLKVEENKTKIEIIEKVDFEGIKDKKGTKNLYNFNTDLNYTLKVPKDLKFDLETISGEIELIDCEGEMSINSISGYIDYTIPKSCKAKIDLSTITGDVYSNVKFDAKIPEEISWVGTNHNLSLNGGEVDVELETVSGDIYLRGK